MAKNNIYLFYDSSLQFLESVHMWIALHKINYRKVEYYPAFLYILIILTFPR